MGKSRQELEEEFFMTADWDKICVNAGLKPKPRRQFYVDTTGLTPEQVKEAIDLMKARYKDKIVQPQIPLSVSEPVISHGTDRDRYPHECPNCKAPAYIGLNSTDCSKGCK